MRKKTYIILGLILLVFILYMSSLFGPKTDEGETTSSYTTTPDGELVDKPPTIVEDAISLEAPKLLKVYRWRVVADQYLHDFVDDQRTLVLLFLNPRTRLLEMNDGEVVLNLIADQLNTVNEISWNSGGRAIVATGNLISEKRDYLLSLDNWNSTDPPSLYPLPFSGSNYFWSGSGRAVAYLGNIDPRTGTSEIFTYNFATQDASTADGVKVVGTADLLWLADGRFVTVEVGEGDKSTLFLVDEKNDGTWSKTLISDKVRGQPDLNSVGDAVLLIEEGNFVVYDFSGKGVERKVVGQPAGTDYVYDFSGADDFHVVYREGDNYYLARVGVDSGSAEKVRLGFVRGVSEALQTLELDSNRRFVLVFSSGTTYAFE